MVCFVDCFFFQLLLVFCERNSLTHTSYQNQLHVFCCRFFTICCFVISAMFTVYFVAMCFTKKSLSIYKVNPLNAELNPICHLLALLGTHHIFHVSGLRVNAVHFPCIYITCVNFSTNVLHNTFFVN